MAGPTENTRSLTSDSLRPGRVSNPVPSEYKPEVWSVPALLRWSVDTRQFAKAVVTLVTMGTEGPAGHSEGMSRSWDSCQYSDSVTNGGSNAGNVNRFSSSVRSPPTAGTIATGGTSPGVKVTTHLIWCGH
jgi:hypothetical protein